MWRGQVESPGMASLRIVCRYAPSCTAGPVLGANPHYMYCCAFTAWFTHDCTRICTQPGGRFCCLSEVLRCAPLALSPLPLIFSYKSEKSLYGTGLSGSLFDLDSAFVDLIDSPKVLPVLKWVLTKGAGLPHLDGEAQLTAAQGQLPAPVTSPRMDDIAGAPCTLLPTAFVARLAPQC